MSMVYFGLPCGQLPSVSTKISCQSRNRAFAITKYQDQTLFWGKQILPCLGQNIRGLQKDVKSRRNFVVYNVVESGVPPQTEPPFNFLHWMMGVVVTVVLPFVTHKWTSLLKIRGDVETAVQNIEDIVDAVEKVADQVEKVAEDIAENLPEGGRLRKAIDFVEHVAERASEDAHLVSDLIDKVQELDDKVEEYAEALAEETQNHLKEVRAHEPTQFANEVHEPPQEVNEDHQPPQEATETHETLKEANYNETDKTY